MISPIAQRRFRFDFRRHRGIFLVAVLTIICDSRELVAVESPVSNGLRTHKALPASQSTANSPSPRLEAHVEHAFGEMLQSPQPGETSLVRDLQIRMEQLEGENARLSQQQHTLEQQIDLLTPQASHPGDCPSSGCGYDHQRGMFLLVDGWKGHHFELRADFFTEARFASFARNDDFWIDSTGTPFPIVNYDSTEITRNFIQLTGSAIDPKLSFTTFVFSSTALNDTLYLGWLSYRFCDALDVRVGTWQLPGTREWYQSFRYTLGTERLMATTFFRPNISPGIWAQGQLPANVRYVLMIANSSNRLAQGITRRGSSRALSATMWWEPSGDFGAGPSDIESHASPSWRLGASMTYSREANQGFGDLAADNPEDTILRLSDGTPLFRPGSLAPGVQLESTHYNLWAIDAAVKYRGFSLSTEYFFRLLNGFVARPTAVPFESLFDHGGLLEGGAFVVPGKLEFFARTSYVDGEFGGGHEYGGGVNWYPMGTRELRLTGEVLQIEDSPAQNLLTGYRAGESGTLFQLQWFADF